MIHLASQGESSGAEVAPSLSSRLSPFSNLNNRIAQVCTSISRSDEDAMHKSKELLLSYVALSELSGAVWSIDTTLRT